jgi:diguanylate cyclase (GGDEF)-like protein/PAS domain S-box-containing protein
MEISKINFGILAFLLSTLLSLGVFALVWPRRRLPGAVAFMIMVLSIALYSLADGFEYQSLTLADNRFWAVVSYPGVLGVPLAFFFFVAQYTGHERYLTKRNLTLLISFSCLVMLAVLTNEWHHLYWSSLTPDPILGETRIYYGHGPLFYIAVVYLYVLLLGGSLFLLQMFFGFHRAYRRQALGILIAVPLPWLSNMLYILNLSPLPATDTTPIFFSIASFIFAINIYYLKLLDLTPVAREIILENLQEGIIVFDRLNRIIDINRAGRLFFDSSKNIQIGQNAVEALPELKDFFKDLPDHMELHLQNASSTWLELRLTPLNSPNGENLGQMLIVQDISTRKQMELELQNKSREMEILAISDMLTGLYNRRHFESALDVEFHRGERYNFPMALAICDLDHFKQINDRFGHSSGDAVLRAVAVALRRAMRNTDVVARMGGDEFVILFLHTSLKDAAIALERLRLYLMNLSISGVGQAVTLSAGVTSRLPGDTPASAMQRADRLLYQAKDMGRNRIVCDDSDNLSRPESLENLLQAKEGD